MITKQQKIITFIILVTTKDKPFQVRIYKVQKSEKDVYKKKQCWKLSDLKIVDGKDDSKVRTKIILYFTVFNILKYYMVLLCPTYTILAIKIIYDKFDKVNLCISLFCSIIDKFTTLLIIRLSLIPIVESNMPLNLMTTLQSLHVT